MGTIDWALILSPLALLLGLGIYSNRYLRGVSDFLTGGRVAGRYLISTAKGEMAVGAVCFAAGFESTGNSGFTVTWWSWINIPVGILVALSGFVIYRYRETRAASIGGPCSLGWRPICGPASRQRPGPNNAASRLPFRFAEASTYSAGATTMRLRRPCASRSSARYTTGVV